MKFLFYNQSIVKRRKITLTSTDPNNDCEFTSQRQMIDIDDEVGVPRGVQQRKDGDELMLPLNNHVLKNNDNRSDMKIECNYHSSTSNRDFRNRSSSDNSGALSQGSNIVTIL